MKKLLGAIIGITFTLIFFTSLNVSAATMKMYINEQYVERDIVNQGGIDLLPIADIAGELGFEYQPTYDGFKLNGKNNGYKFTLGKASVYDYNNNWIGLDVVPKIVDNKIRIPSTFVTKTLGYSYTWDYTTNIIFVNSPKALAESTKYYNATNEITQIRNFISWGLYLEAIQVCEETLAWHELSESDKTLINYLKIIAQNCYEAYLYDMEQNKTATYYFSSWCMGFTFLDSASPMYLYGAPYEDQYVSVYDTTVNSVYSQIRIRSYELGSQGIWSPSQAINGCVEFMRGLTSQDAEYGSDFTVLSNSATTVGNIPAQQATVRCEFYENRYHTQSSYKIMRFTAFQYGNWIYILVAREDAYTWSDDFWNKMEMVRTTISFY